MSSPVGWPNSLSSAARTFNCLDGDPVNRSLGQYKALRAEKLDLVNSDGLVQRTRYDALLERFASEEAVFFLDSGATAFLPFWIFVADPRLQILMREVWRAPEEKKWRHGRSPEGYKSGQKKAG